MKSLKYLMLALSLGMVSLNAEESNDQTEDMELELVVEAQLEDSEGEIAYGETSTQSSTAQDRQKMRRDAEARQKRKMNEQKSKDAGNITIDNNMRNNPVPARNRSNAW